MKPSEAYLAGYFSGRDGRRTMRLLFALGLLQRGQLAFGQNQAFLGDLGFQRLEPFLHRLQIMTLPDAANAGRRN